MPKFRAGQILTADDLNAVTLELKQRIDEQILPADQATVNFPAIPQEYTNLAILCHGGLQDTGNTVHQVHLRFNGDAGASAYEWYHHANIADGTFTDPNSAGDNAFVWATWGTQENISSAIIYIFDYASSSGGKVVQSSFGASAGELSADVRNGQCYGRWLSGGAPATSLSLFCKAGNLINSGSKFSMYGFR